MIGIQALTGRKPHQLPEDNRTGNILWRDKAEVSEELADIIDNMVRDHFSQRYQDAAEALEVLMDVNIEFENESVLEFRQTTLTQTFTTVKVNGKGEIIERPQEQAEVMQENLGNGVILEMVLIPGGSFLMGSPNTEANRRNAESPQHQVTLQPFFMSKYPITQEQYQIIMGKNSSHFKGAKRPVEMVTWYEATEFCEKLSEKTGKIYRLPSESQWEYACRAGTTTPFYFGETITSDLVNYNGNYSYRNTPQGIYREETINVGSFPPNAFGLYDMHGNVREWCQDVWHDNYNHAPTDGTAWESRQNNNLRLLRGGAWYDLPKYCRCADRVRNKPNYQVNGIGFRVATNSKVSHDSSSKSTKITLPSTSLLEPLPETKPISSTQIFTTVKVNEKGEIIDRRQQQAQVMIEHLPNGIILEMVLIPGGSFLMGSPNTELKRTIHESPQHYVDVPTFFMGKYPVTQAQWETVMGNNPSFFKGANLPVEKVSWNDAIQFCQRLSDMTGKNYRLPSEAEWEYACRARTSTPFYFGETITTELANYRGSSTYASELEGIERQETTDVGSFPANAFGLYDMHGNVWEWCQDIWHYNYETAPTDGSVWESRENSNSDSKLLRGGSWSDVPKSCRCANRVRRFPLGQDEDIGFRLVIG